MTSGMVFVCEPRTRSSLDGDGVIVVEAMKMESELKTNIDGKITEINVKEGDTVDLGAPLLTIESQDKKEE